jgi:hypothetical protein
VTVCHTHAHAHSQLTDKRRGMQTQGVDLTAQTKEQKAQNC